jgi:rRNA maturation endonuclease Nob1
MMSGFELTFQIAKDVNLDYVTCTLRDQANEGRNVGRGLAGTAASVAVNRYLQWVSGVEPQVKNVFTDPEVWTRLRSDVYWRIRELNDLSPRWQELIYTESELQASRLEELVAEVETLEKRLNAVDGRLTVVDTNVLLEHQAPDQINWSDVVNTSPVRLVVPLRVLDELDEKKYTARDDKADWARRLLSRLWRTVGPVGGEPVRLTDGVTVEVPIGHGRRRRTVDADQEVIDTCDTIRRAGGSVVLVTGDYGMAIRASALNIPVAMMPERYLRRQIKRPETGLSAPE